MAKAEAHIKVINAEGAVEALLVNSDNASSRPPFPKVNKVRVRKVAHNLWAYTSGQCVPSYQTLYVDDQALVAALEQKRAEYDTALEVIERVQEEAWDLVRAAKTLE